MRKQLDNIGVLREFLEIHNLSFDKARIGFDCTYYVETEKNTNGVSVEAKTRISFNGFDRNEGEVIVDCDLPVKNYPTTFLAYYNDMSIEDDELVITGNHPTIKEYKSIISL